MTFDTLNTKPGHHENGHFCVGSGSEVVVILGSCRVLPYLNYLNILNSENRFSLVLINIVNFSFDQQDQPVDGREFTKRFENEGPLWYIVKQCKIFIHEHCENYGCFNTSRESEKNIYQFGMAPEIDISIPNFHNIFILFQELVDLDAAVHEWAKNDIAATGELSEELKAKVKEKGMARIQDFLEICAKTDLPEFGDVFQSTWQYCRYWWTGNHVSSAFTESVFGMMNSKYFKIEPPVEFLEWCKTYNPYSTPCSKITRYDREAFGIQWPQPTEELTV